MKVDNTQNATNDKITVTVENASNTKRQALLATILSICAFVIYVLIIQKFATDDGRPDMAVVMPVYVTGLFIVIYIIVFFIIKHMATQKLKQKKIRFGKDGSYLREMLRMQSIYSKLALHIVDTVTDYGLLVQWGIYWYQEKFLHQTPVPRMNMSLMFKLLAGSVFMYRCISAIAMRQYSIFMAVLQFFDVAIFRAIYHAYIHGNTEPTTMQQLIGYLEAIFEAFPEVVLTWIFLVRVEQTGWWVILSSLGSIISLSVKMISEDKPYVIPNAQQWNSKKTSRDYIIRVLFRVTDVCARISTYIVTWYAIGGEVTCVVAAIDVFVWFICLAINNGCDWKSLWHSKNIKYWANMLVSMPIVDATIGAPTRATQLFGIWRCSISIVVMSGVLVYHLSGLTKYNMTEDIEHVTATTMGIFFVVFAGILSLILPLLRWKMEPLIVSKNPYEAQVYEYMEQHEGNGCDCCEVIPSCRSRIRDEDIRANITKLHKHDETAFHIAAKHGAVNTMSTFLEMFEQKEFAEEVQKRRSKYKKDNVNGNDILDIDPENDILDRILCEQDSNAPDDDEDFLKYLKTQIKNAKTQEKCVCGTRFIHSEDSKPDNIAATKAVCRHCSMETDGNGHFCPYGEQNHKTTANQYVICGKCYQTQTEEYGDKTAYECAEENGHTEIIDLFSNKQELLVLTDSNKVEENEVVIWLTKDVNLTQYIDTFVGNGYTDMRAVKAMDKNDMIEIGITLPGHQKLINECIKQLQ